MITKFINNSPDYCLIEKWKRAEFSKLEDLEEYQREVKKR